MENLYRKLTKDKNMTRNLTVLNILKMCLRIEFVVKSNDKIITTTWYNCSNFH